MTGPRHDRARGYTRESFADAFIRYIPGPDTVHPYIASKNNSLDENPNVHQKNECTVENSAMSKIFLQTHSMPGSRFSQLATG